MFVCALLGLSIFIERPFCKYLCPLGASLAIPSTFRWFGLKRKQDCNSCKACAVGCGAQAIDTAGRIDHRECLHCLDCMILYTDVKGCPPLAKERKRRERDGLEITPIGKNGYFIPITPDTSWQAQISAKAANGPDPRMPTDPVQLPSLHNAPLPKRLALEVGEHLSPWSAASWQSHRMLSLFAMAAAIAAVAAWVLLGMGRISTSAIILSWFGWSVVEVWLRMTGKRYVKDGVWWSSRYRRANLMDMLAYVAFKNLLVGAALLLILRAVNWTVA